MIKTRFLIAVSALIFFTACTESRQQRLLQVGEQKVAQGRYAEASEALRKAISLQPESKTGIKAFYKLGFIQETYLKDLEAALFNYQEYIRLSQDRMSIYEVQKRIANLYFENDYDPEKAIAAYKKLLGLNPESLEVDLFQFRIALSYFQQNNFEQARYEFQQLIEKFPRSQYNPKARFEIGNAYYMEGKYDIAVEALKQVIRHHPQSSYSSEAMFLTGLCLEHQNKLQDAFHLYESILNKYPAPEVVHLRIEGMKKRLKLKPVK